MSKAARIPTDNFRSENETRFNHQGQYLQRAIAVSLLRFSLLLTGKTMEEIPPAFGH
ncbi:MAG: hypothetical protein NW206_09465 [Hyphomonadaceae bacterium]|nr:hypothetical protein [Hyphomonadaceae bacterium]